MITTILAFVFTLGVLIFIHELGHFLVAKWVGIGVERFSVGFPPYIVNWRRGGTAYSIGLIPLGGFVKMRGENPDDESSGADDEFMSKSVGQRAAVIFAGPFMNYALAVFLMIGILYFGGRPVYDDERSVVGTLAEGGPAEQAGLQVGDQIVAVDGQAVTSFESMRQLINARVQAPVDVTWVRGVDTMTASVTTTVGEQPRADGGIDTVGMIGISQQVLAYENYGIVESVERGFVAAHTMVYKTVEFVYLLISGQVSSKMIGGPLFIAKQAGREAEQGASRLFLFMALLSVNLAVLNVLPIPVLDGGHLVFLAIEAVKGKPLSVRARGLAQQIGLIVLLSLIIFVTYNDIMR
ncbi:MAG: RIP metalloprotease RseP [candidate division Zixibacteria bacterium]|jgi:regulator of sigma E protease|nr:RIP metalloprotease RseP [candidate division Zixibacteria bacterium]